jgi:hypothetical protein
MRDAILASFLEAQQAAGMELAKESDILELFPLDGPATRAAAAAPARHYVARFHCLGLVRSPDGVVREADQFDVGIRFPLRYLRQQFDPVEVLTWLAPFEIHHPNIKPPLLCPGKLARGTPLVDIVYQLYEIISYARLTMREDHALNRDACAWARRNRDRFPLDRRPLKRSPSRFAVEPTDSCPVIQAAPHDAEEQP